MEGPPTKTGPYTTIDFRALAKKDSEFKKLWTQSSGHLNFQSPSTCLTLTKALLKTDFGLELDIPDDRLCPPVPNRWNYVVWLQELLASTSPDYMMSDERARGDSVEDEKEIVGLDIGAGASAIYTMLCLKSNPKWRMCLTDADKKSFDYAARNLALNKLLTRTTMLQTTQDMPLIPLKALGVETLDFTICNPPFFSDEAEMQASLKGEGKIAQPNSVCTGAASEMVCPGGDLGFVTRIVEESLVLRERVRWYSSMLGKLSSVKAVIELLKKEGVKNWAVGYLDPGGSGGTKRWLVAWSFGDLRPRNDIARIEIIPHEYLPFPTQFKIPIPEGHMINEAIDTIIGTISSLDIRWRWNATDRVGTGEAFANVWNRAYRREQMRKQKSGGLSKGMDEDEKPVALAFRIHVAEQPTKEVVLDWLRGTDVQLWESFYGMMHRHFKNPTDKPKKTKEPTGITEERPSSSGKGFSRF